MRSTTSENARNMTNQNASALKTKTSAYRTLKRIWKFRWQFAMILPAMALLLVFNYLPMAGLQIAFRDYDIFNGGIWGSPWVGLEHFSFVTDPEFWRLFTNTIWITVLKLLFVFTTPIALAILLNEVRSPWFKRIVQSLTYMPHFVSWIIVAYIIEAFLSDTGLINYILTSLGFESIYFMGDVTTFRPLIVLSSIWKEVGWSSIIYLAAIAGIDPQMYEAARVDGANKWRQIWNVTLPGLMPTISIMLILYMPNLLNAGFDQIYPLQNSVNLPVSEVMDTYIVRTGLDLGYYGPASAIGLVTGILQLCLVAATNALSRRVGGSRLY